jgi:hypothetical protein
VFNRPDTTRKVFDVIKTIRPEKLYIAADGARSNKAGETILCAETRDIVAQVDWPCTVRTLFRSENMGCKLAVSEAITWFFEQEEMGIILEDDCLPSLSFFPFCDHLLDLYKDDERIMHIGGANFQNGQLRGDASYYFSCLPHVWGWATWSRAWRMYDIELSDFQQVEQRSLFKSIVYNVNFRKIWMRFFSDVKEGKINTWDFQWVYSIWKSNGLCIVPNINLISNIGFGPQATHTMNDDSKWANIPTGEIKQMVDPNVILADTVADEYAMSKIFVEDKRLWRYIKRVYNVVGRWKS